MNEQMSRTERRKEERGKYPRENDYGRERAVRPSRPANCDSNDCAVIKDV